MTTLREALGQAQQMGTALGHFNVSELVAFKAITETARKLGVPVLVGVSEGEREFIGSPGGFRAGQGHPGRRRTRRLPQRRSHALPGEGRGSCACRIRRGALRWIGLELRGERRADPAGVEAVKSIDDRIVVEGEIGWIGASSEIHEKAPEGLERGLTTPEQAREFVAATGVDVLAPAVGNMHGLLKSMVRGESQKRLDIARIRRIKEATKVFMTLHGASGTNQDDLAEAIRAGMNIVHINTELRLAWRRALESALARSPDVLAPYKILLEPLHAIETVVGSRLELFQGSVNRARGDRARVGMGFSGRAGASASEDTMLDDKELVAIASFENLSEAEMAKVLLAAEGITVVIRDQPLASLLPAVALANGGLTLLVAADQVDLAREVLAKPDSPQEPSVGAGTDV